jgi:hypothetical protein
MSTDSTEPTDGRGFWSRWTRSLLVPALIAIVVGAAGGGAFYYVHDVRKPAVRHTNPSAARRVASDHMLIAIQNEASGTSAVAMIGRTHQGPKILTISPNLIVEVPGVGPRSVALAVREAGAEATAVAVANALRVTVPAAMAAGAPDVAGTIDELGGVTVTVPEDLRSNVGGFTRTAFVAGPAQLTGDTFIRYMTGSFVGETETQRDRRQLAGWRGLLAGATRSTAAAAFASWTTDLPPASALALVRSCSSSPASLALPVTPIALANEHLVRIDEGALAPVRESLVDFTNGAETLDGRRVRLVIRASGAVGPIVGRILVNAGYVIEMSGRTTTPATITRVAVAPSVPDAEATGRDIASLLGMGLVKVSTDTSADTDIILTVGMDWAEANGFPQR